MSSGSPGRFTGKVPGDRGICAVKALMVRVAGEGGCEGEA
jgi:hypothetical protein